MNLKKQFLMPASWLKAVMFPEFTEPGHEKQANKLDGLDYTGARLFNTRFQPKCPGGSVGRAEDNKCLKHQASTWVSKRLPNCVPGFFLLNTRYQYIRLRADYRHPGLMVERKRK